jgi:peptide methionine sulfoxide reductase MsrA
MAIIKKPEIKRVQGAGEGFLEVIVEHSQDEIGKFFILQILFRRNGPGQRIGQWEDFRRDIYEVTSTDNSIQKKWSVNLRSESGFQERIQFRATLFEAQAEASSEELTV